ncbi:MAG: hypothetical protein PWP45_199 [Tepidanaerobacteraceae bacterium]|nr:hypothetical protein [Tepidanaerobacteraceae bacterium]
MQDISGKIISFFKDFSQIEVEVIDVMLGPDGVSVLCKLPDGEYQVILGDDLSVKAYYRKKPYIKDVMGLPGNPLERENISFENSHWKASNSEQNSQTPTILKSKKAMANITLITNPLHKIFSPILKKWQAKMYNKT